MAEAEIQQNIGKRILVILLTMIALFSMNYPAVRNRISTIAQIGVFPIFSDTHKRGVDTGDFFHSLTHVYSIYHENADLKARVVKLESEVESIAPVLDENLELQRQLKISAVEKKFDKATVFTPTPLDTQMTNIYINKGRDAGVVENSRVFLGKTLLGYAQDVQSNRSKILPLTERTVANEAFIIINGDGIERMMNSDKPDPSNVHYIHGVAVGTGKSIRIENIDITADIHQGDPVFVKDFNTGSIYYLGKVADIEESPTSTMKIANVLQEVNIVDLNSVFVTVQ